MNDKKLVVMKFGGTSVGTADAIRKVGTIVQKTMKDNNVIVVVSALAGVTDLLKQLVKNNNKSDRDRMRAMHFGMLDTLSGDIARKTDSRMLALFKDIENTLTKDRKNPRIQDYILSFGEKLSALVVGNYLNNVCEKGTVIYSDRGLIVTNNKFGNAVVNFEKTNNNINRMMHDRLYEELFIVTGFIGTNSRGHTTTLGRNTSDYTAVILAAALDAKAVEIWKDVDGVMSGDPKIINNPVVIDCVSYEETIESAYFDSKIINRKALELAMHFTIPVYIRNTFYPELPGTLISKKTSNRFPSKIFTATDNITLINVKGPKLIGVPKTAAKIFQAIGNAKVNIIWISQTSSEYTICFAVKQNDTEKTLKVLKRKFKNGITTGVITIEIVPHQTICAVIGDNMKGTSGISGKVFKTLGDHNINVSGISQGSSERNISFVVDSTEKQKALNTVHDAFIHNGNKNKNIFLVGTGNVGKEVLYQLACSPNQYLNILGIINTRQMIYGLHGISPGLWEKYDTFKPSNWEQFKKFAIESCISGENILVDCTASEEIAKSYLWFAEHGFYIVAANKWFNAYSPIAEYQKLREIFEKTGKKFRYSATVGAGLPVIDTIQTTKCADVITKIECAPSGTINFVFSKDCSFSEAVQEAKNLRLTESDPRIDLSGSDVFGKMVTLKRDIGWYNDPANVYVENLTSDKDKPFEAYNRIFRTMVETAENENCVIRYIAEITESELTARLKMVPKDSKMGLLKGTENIFMIYTEKRKEPIVISGEGAGKEVTAAAVIADILKCV